MSELERLRAFQAKAVEELRIVEREIGVPSEALKLLETPEGAPRGAGSNVCTCGREATGDHESGCTYRPEWM